MSSTCLSGFGHTSPLSRNGFPYVASVHQASSRTHRVSFFLFQDDRLFSAQMCASCSVICAHTQKALNRTGLPVLLDCSSLIKNQADEEIEISAKSSNKYRYQANRAFIIGFMKRLLHKILCTISTIDEINRLYSEAVRNRSQIMPGRTFKRKKNKAKGRTHFNNQKVSF